MLSNAQIKFIRSLHQKKYRIQHQSFIAEGEKIVSELLATSFSIRMICALPAWVEKNQSILPHNISCVEISVKELDRISALKTPNQVLAVVDIPEYTVQDSELENDLTLVLDNLQDPGNLGTIIRTADWFGIEHIICSPATADVYNPKVVQATMGSLLRVKVHYTELWPLLKSLKNKLPVYGTTLEGRSLFEHQPELPGILIIGSESHGISEEVKSMVTEEITIPGFERPNRANKVDSLNASVAAGILMAWFRKT